MILHVKGVVDYIDFNGNTFLSISNGLSFQFESLSDVKAGEEVDLWLYMIMKEIEGKMDLKFYAFPSTSIIGDFDQLMSISGVGPKMAFSILKNIPKSKLVEVVRKGEFQEIKKLPGIGDKLAKRIVLELSRIFGKDDDILLKMQKENLTDDQNEVMITLIQMGFDKNVILQSMKEVDSNLSKKELLKEVLLKATIHGK